MIEAVVFDFDGVLIDSPKIYNKTMHAFLKKHDLVLSEDELSRLISFSLHQEFDFLKEKYPLKVSFEEFLKETLLESKKEMEKNLELMPGAKELLVSLKEKGIPLGLASNNNRRVVQWVLNKFSLASFFDAVVPVELVSNPKPSPDIYLKNAEILAVNPKNCVGLEDTIVGLQSLKNAGFKSIVCPNSFSDKSLFKDADFVVGSLLDIDAKKVLNLGGG